MVAVDKWLLFRGGRKLRFDCIQHNIQLYIACEVMLICYLDKNSVSKFVSLIFNTELKC